MIEELAEKRIVATGTLIVEQKFLRGCAKVNYYKQIEDTEIVEEVDTRACFRLCFWMSQIVTRLE